MIKRATNYSVKTHLYILVFGEVIEQMFCRSNGLFKESQMSIWNPLFGNTSGLMEYSATVSTTAVVNEMRIIYGYKSYRILL